MAKLFGREIRWSDSPATDHRQLEQVTDIGVAFDDAVDRLSGATPQAIPAVYRATQMIADVIGSLHMEEYYGQVNTGQIPPLLANPDPEYTYHDTLSYIGDCLVKRGNAYLMPMGRDPIGNPTSVHVLDPDEVTVALDHRRMYPVYSWRGRTLVRNEEIFHIRLNRMIGGIMGAGPIEAARLMLQGVAAEQELQRQLASDDATPRGVLKVEKQISQDEAEKLKDQWVQNHGSGRKRPAVLGGGTTFEPLAFKPVDMEWIESRRFSVQEIARLFGLHGFFLLVDSGSSLTYSTTESLFRLWLTMTLRPTYLERIEQVFSRMLPTGRVARFNVDEILRADIEARYRAHQIGITAGFKTINEARKEEGLTAVAGGDQIREPQETPQNAPQPAAAP